MRARRSSLVGGAGALALVAGLVVGLPTTAQAAEAKIVVATAPGIRADLVNQAERGFFLRRAERVAQSSLCLRFDRVALPLVDVRSRARAAAHEL